MNPKVKRVAKAAIAIVVVIGLVLATRTAVDQWNHQRDAALLRVTALEQSLSGATSPAERAALNDELTIARSRVPDLARLDRGRILLAAACYWISLVPGGLVLFEANRALGYRVRCRDAVAAQIVGHLGKYVPGKAMVVVIRAGRLAMRGVPVLTGSVAVFLETLMMMAVGAALAGTLIFFLPVERWIAWGALLGGIVASFPTLPPIMKRLVRRVGVTPEQPVAGGDRIQDDPRGTASMPGIGQAIDHDWRFFSLAWFWQLIAWGLIGASFGLLVTSFPGAETRSGLAIVYAASIAAIALAMVVGFASLLPGGAGVRELTLAVVLTPVVGASTALIAAIMARILFILVELLAAGCVTILSRATASGNPIGFSK